MPRVARALRVRSGEGRVVSRMLALMVALFAGAALGANAVESLFFVRFGPEFLPYLYVVLGVLTFGAMMGIAVLMGGSAPERAVARIPLGLAGVVLAMRAAIALPGRWIYPVMWLAMMVVWTVQTLAAWGVAGAVHHTRQAKRLFPLYGSGLILGTVAGGLATGPLARAVGPENLLLMWAAALAVAWWLSRAVLASRQPAAARRAPSRRRGPAAGIVEGYAVVRGSGLLRWMTVALALFALLYYALALLFAQAATARFPDASRLAGFLGLFMGISSGAALLVSLVVANRLFAKFGVATMVLILPVIYTAGFGVLATASTFGAVVAFRFVQMTWVNGVWASGWQALFNVVPPEHRDRVRTFMDGVPLQAGVIASGVLLILARRLLPPPAVAGVAAVLSAVAVLAVWRLRRAYAGAVVAALRAGNPEVFVPEEEPFGGFLADAEATSAVLEGAASPDPAVRRVSVEVLAEMGSSPPVLREALEDEDPVVRAAALRGVARHPDPEARVAAIRLLADAGPAVRSGAIRALVVCAADEAAARARGLLSDPDPGVRALAAAVVRPEAEGRRVLSDLAASPIPAERVEAARALGETRRDPEILTSLLADPEPEVRLAAVSALGSFSPVPPVQGLLPLLEDPDPDVWEAALVALAGVGEEARAPLTEALSDPRREAGAILALAALPGSDPEVLRSYAREKVRLAVRYGSLARGMEVDGDERMALVAHALRDRSTRYALPALRAVGRLGDPTATRLAIENLSSRDSVQRANALEVLEAVGEPDIVRPLVAVWEEGEEPPRSGADLLPELLADPDPWVRACAAFAAVRRQDLRAAVGGLARSDADRVVRDVAAAALEEDDVETLSRLSLIERVVFLRRVPLFATLSPPDLKQVAEAATEHTFPAGTVMAEQGAPGEEMFIVVSGEIRVLVGGDGREVARRRAGDYVGEMAVISEEPRMASLVCADEVRALALDRRRFERILRDRPEASLSVMRVLCDRLRERYEGRPT